MRRVLMTLATLALAIPVAAMAQVTYGNRPPPHNGYPGNAGQVVNCGSSDNRPASCPMPPGWHGARLVQQTSRAACIEGRTWGYNRNTIWVNNGCRANFAAAGGWRPGPGWDRNIELSCGSPQYHYAFCQVDVGARGNVVVVRQISDTRCIQGQNWGWNRAGVWVDKGCSARFRVMRRW